MNHDPESGTPQRQSDQDKEKHGQTGPGKTPINSPKPGGSQQPQQPGVGNRGNEGQRPFRPGEGQKQQGNQGNNPGRKDQDDDEEKQRGGGMP